jgi:hypothetical protein
MKNTMIHNFTDIGKNKYPISESSFHRTSQKFNRRKALPLPRVDYQSRFKDPSLAVGKYYRKNGERSCNSGMGSAGIYALVNVYISSVEKKSLTIQCLEFHVSEMSWSPSSQTISHQVVLHTPINLCGDFENRNASKMF